jgi:hypothetical protein
VLIFLQNVVDVLATLVLKAISAITPSLPSGKYDANDWSAGLEAQFGIMRCAALIMYKASPTSKLKGSAALAQLLKAICSFSCQLITHSSPSVSNCSLSFVSLRACVKWFGFCPNVFAGLRDAVFNAAFGIAADGKNDSTAASAAAAVLCVNITLSSCELTSPPATSLCTALASAILSSPTNSQLVEAASVRIPPRNMFAPAS